MSEQPEPRGLPALRRDLQWGVTTTLGTAAVLAIWVTIVRLVSGPGPFARNGVSYGQTLLLYAALAISGGLLVGALCRFTGTPGGVRVVGAIVGAFVMFGIGAWAVGLSEVVKPYMLLTSSAVGSIAGLVGATVHLAARGSVARRGDGE